MKYVINSKGETVTIPDNQNIIRQIPQELRENELLSFSNEFIALLQEKDIVAKDVSFCYMTQPFYTTERLLFFAKTEFSSSSQAVKLANELEKHPEILASRERTEFLQSILPEDCDGRTRWFFLNVGYIAFERNMYDCKRINAKYVPPIPYARFKKELNSLLITPEDLCKEEICFRFKLNTNGLDLNDISALLSVSFVRDIKNGHESDFDITVSGVIEDYKKQKYAFKDKNSNKATSCLSIINGNNQQIYPIYREVKTCIKKAYKGAYNVQYKGNCITAQLSTDQKLTLYVSGTQDAPQFIFGGKSVAGIEALKQMIQSDAIFQETEWFIEKVKPNIQEQTTIKPKPKSRNKDEIGWTKNESNAVKKRQRKDK